MRVGIIAWLHESNTFVKRTTTRENFEDDLLVTGEAVREKMEHAKHEVGGFFSGLAEDEFEAVPIFAARAYPSGVIEAGAFSELEDLLLSELESAGQLDGILVDLPTAYFMTAVQIPEQGAEGVIVAQFAIEAADADDYGMLFAKGNELVPCVNEALGVLKGGGTLQSLEDEWLAQGGDVATITE